MTFIYELDLYSLKIYLRAKNGLSRSNFESYRITDTHIKCIHTDRLAGSN